MRSFFSLTLLLLLSGNAFAATSGTFICTTSEVADSAAAAMKPVQDFLNKNCNTEKTYSISGGRSDWDRGQTYTYGACCIAK